MSLLEFHPKYRPFVASAVLALCVSPAAWHGYRYQSTNDERRAATEQVEKSIALNDEKTIRDEQIALKRAERCVLINEKFPLVEGGKVFYDPKMRKDSRLLPEGTKLCSKSGITAIVDEAGTVSSIKQAPIEKVNQILKQRGLF